MKDQDGGTSSKPDSLCGRPYANASVCPTVSHVEKLAQLSHDEAGWNEHRGALEQA